MHNRDPQALFDSRSLSGRSNSTIGSRILLKLHYEDHQQDVKIRHCCMFSPTDKVYDVIHELLWIANPRNIHPSDVSLVELVYGNERSSPPPTNRYWTLNELKIKDGHTLYFKRSATIVSSATSYLSISGANTSSLLSYKWDKATTTLGMLLEHVIQTLSLDSIERERIHLFYRFEELDLASNCDNLLKDLDIEENRLINVEIVPPIVHSTSWPADNLSTGRLSSLTAHETTRSSSDAAQSRQIELELEYNDSTENPTKRTKAQFQSLDTVRDVIKKFLKLLKLEQISPDDIELAEVRHSMRCSIPKTNAHMTLKELKIEDGYILRFQRSPTSVSKDTCSLRLRLRNHASSTEYSWHKTKTTLGMLLKYATEHFSLKSIPPKHIRLTTNNHKQLDHIANSDKLLSQLGIADPDLIYIETIRSCPISIDSANWIIHVNCYCSNTQFFFDVSLTDTIQRLKEEIEKQYEGHQLTELMLYDEENKEIDLNNSSRMLKTLGIRTCGTITATCRLVSCNDQSSTMNKEHEVSRFSSIISRNLSNNVIVRYKSPVVGCRNITVSVDDTVGDLVTRLKSLEKHRSLSRFVTSHQSIRIDNIRSDQRLVDLGIKPGDVIDVTTTDDVLVHNSIESRHTSSLYLTGRLSGTQSSPSRPTGLANLGNTCYMNSALQSLAHVKPLTHFFLHGLIEREQDNNKFLDAEWNQFYTIGTVTGAYADLLRNLWLPNKIDNYYYYSFHSSFRPQRIREAISLLAPRFATWDQQDAQEFMTFLLDEMHKEFKEKNDNQTKNIVEELFFGAIQSTITCLECKHEEKTINPINCLPLSLNRQGRIFTIRYVSRNGECELRQVTVLENDQVKNLIEAFCEKYLSSVFIYDITAMTNDGPLDSDMLLSQLSTTEVMLVERDYFTSNFRSYRSAKHMNKLTLEDCLREFCSIEQLEDSWSCPQETCKKNTKATKQLKLSSFPSILIIQLKRFSHENGLRKKLETFVEYPITGLNLSSLVSSSNEIIYDLFAVINHIGSIYGGHYIACAQHEVNGTKEWYKFDDSYVSSYCYDTDIVSRDAYILFYMKREKLKQPPTTIMS